MNRPLFRLVQAGKKDLDLSCLLFKICLRLVVAGFSSQTRIGRYVVQARMNSLSGLLHYEEPEVDYDMENLFTWMAASEAGAPC